MKILVRAIVTGFGLSIGALLYKKVAKRFGFDDQQPKADDLNARDGATDPGLRQPHPHHQPS